MIARLADSTVSRRAVDNCYVKRSEREALGSMVYADGSRMERGDLVVIPAEAAAMRVYRIAGWDLHSGTVMLTGIGLSGVYHRKPGELARWGGAEVVA